MEINKGGINLMEIGDNNRHGNGRCTRSSPCLQSLKLFVPTSLSSWWTRNWRESPPLYRKNCSNDNNCIPLPAKQDSHKMSMKNNKLSNRNHEHRRHIRCRSQTGHWSLKEHRPAIHKSIHAPRQVQDQSNPQDATEAQITRRGKRDECSPRTALNTYQHPQNGQCRLHCGIQ